MARARLLKPGFFTNDALGDVEPAARLLFAGLWCLADSEGRLQDRPRRIKAEVLPYDDMDVDRLLEDLAERAFILRYEVGGERYIQVAAFSRHQRPHHREPPSTIPPCTEQASADHGASTDEASVDHGASTVEACVDHGASTVEACVDHGASTVEAWVEHGSITGPDGSLRPDGVRPDSTAITHPNGAEHAPSTAHASAKQVASCPPVTPNQIQKPIPEAEAEADPDPEADPVPVAVADPGPAAGAGARPRPREPAAPADESTLPELLRHWERTTGAAISPAVSQWLAAEIASGLPPGWLHDAINETAANGSKAWKYTKAIIERWRSQGRTPRGGNDVRTRNRTEAERRLYGPCRATGRPHPWPELDGWCPECQEQEPITEDMLRRRGLLVE